VHKKIDATSVSPLGHNDRNAILEGKEEKLMPPYFCYRRVREISKNDY
jgi:hypothetical protein